MLRAVAGPRSYKRKLDGMLQEAKNTQVLCGSNNNGLRWWMPFGAFLN
jgi:hypothetical protein